MTKTCSSQQIRFVICGTIIFSKSFHFFKIFFGQASIIDANKYTTQEDASLSEHHIYITYSYSNIFPLNRQNDHGPSMKFACLVVNLINPVIWTRCRRRPRSTNAAGAGKCSRSRRSATPARTSHSDTCTRNR